MKDPLDYSYEPRVEVSNIVANVALDAAVQLDHLTLKLGMDAVEYEPEQFPALMYRRDGYVILVFSSGKILCTGLTELSDVHRAVDELKEEVQAVA